MKRFIPFLVLALAVVLFFPKIFFAHHTFISSGVISTDLYLFNYPLKSLMHKTLLRGQGIPFWTDLIGNGYPIFAEGQMGELYPLHLFFFMLPFKTIDLFNANLMIHYILSSIFTYLYIKKCIKLSSKASVLGALVYTFSGYMLTHLHQVNIILELTYFPLDLLIAETILGISVNTQNSKKVSLGLLLTLILYLQLSAGHIEMVYYNILFTGVYCGIRLFFDRQIRSALLSKIIIGCIAVTISIMVTIPQLYATYELVKFSQRETGISYEATTGTLWPLNTLILFINPKAYDVYRAEPGYSPNKQETVNIGALYPYVGILPLMLSIVAIAWLFKKQSKNTTNQSNLKIWILTFLVLTTFTYLYAVGRSTQLFSVIWEVIPGMKFFRFPVKAIYIIEFSIAILASLGIEILEEIIVNKRKTITTKSTQNKEILLKKSSLEIAGKEGDLGKNAGNKSLANIVIILIICISYADLWYFNGATQPTIPADNWLKTPEFATYINSQDPDCHCSPGNNKYQKTSADNTIAPRFQNWRSYSHGTNNIDYTRIFDFPLQKDLQNILHIDFNLIHDVSLNREWAVLFLQRQTLLNKFNTQVNLSEGKLSLPKAMKKSLDLQSVRYLIADLEIKDPDLILIKKHQFSSPVNHVLFMANSIEANNIPTQTAYLYENKTYFPRITLTPESNATYLQSNDKTGENILQAVLSPEFNPTQKTIIESPPKDAHSSEKSFQGDFTMRSYEPQNIVLQTDTTAPAYLSLADTYYPGWKATVDGKETEILKANYAFKAIAVPEGKHIVTVTFMPTSWKYTTLILLTGWSMVISGILFISINKLGILKTLTNRF